MADSKNKIINICDNSDFGINSDIGGGGKVTPTKKLTWDRTNIFFDSTKVTFDNG